MGLRKSIYEYDNYRDFLKDAYFDLKQTKKAFSFRYFSKLAGFTSPNMLKRVIDGQRNLTEDSIEKFATALKLNKGEGLFFRNLVRLNQAKTVDEKQFYTREILKSKAYNKIHPLSESQYNYLRKWYFVTIREMVSLPSFKEDPDWISKKLDPPVSAMEVKRAIEEMLQLGILYRNQEGQLSQTDKFIMTADEVVSSAAAEFHREMMKRAAESIDRVPREKRELSALTISISEETAKRLKAMIQEFRKRLMEVATEDQSPQSVYQLNFHLFPLVDMKKEGG